MFYDISITDLLAGAGNGDLPPVGLLRHEDTTATTRPALSLEDFPAGLRLAGAAWLYHGSKPLA
jgi:hypothetical protein